MSVQRTYTTKSGEVRHKSYDHIKEIDVQTYRREADKLYRQRRKEREEGRGKRLKKFSNKTLAEKLAPEVRQIMVLYRQLGLSLCQIAKRIGVSRYTVERALALEHLQGYPVAEAADDSGDTVG